MTTGWFRLWWVGKRAFIALEVVLTARKGCARMERKNGAFFALLYLLSAMLFLVQCGGGRSESNDTKPANPPVSSGPRWSVQDDGQILTVFYGSGSRTFQYAAFHYYSSYFRLVAPGTAWGTSVIVFPSFWKGGTLYQGTRVGTSYQVKGEEVEISFSGEAAGLRAHGTITMSPPNGDKIVAAVSVTTEGDVSLDAGRSHEAFKPVMLSSMRIDENLWDADFAFAEGSRYDIPDGGWINPGGAMKKSFGLRGGTSHWKESAVTVTIDFDRALDVTGWVTKSNDPNDDNVGFWGATTSTLPVWEYTITASR